MNFIAPGVGSDQIDKLLIFTAPIGNIDHIRNRGKRGEVGNGMLGSLYRAALNFLDQRRPGPKLAARCQFDINLSIGAVLNVFFHIQLHNGIAARCPQDISSSDVHFVFGCLFALRLFMADLRAGLFGTQYATE